jgi:cytochrome c biogenesis protein
LKVSLAATNTVENEGFYTQGEYHAEIILPISNEQIGHKMIKELRRNGYQVSQNKSNNSVFLAGDKRRFSNLGTYIIHLSLLLFVLGFLLGSYLGFRNSSFIIAEDTVRNIGYGTGLSLRLESFTDEYWPDGTPKDFRSEVVILEDGQEVKRGIIQVNHPVSYKGIRLHQSFFGPAARISIQNSEGKVLYQGNVAMPETTSAGNFQRPLGGLKISGTTYSIALLGSAINAPDTAISTEEIGLECYDNSLSAPTGWTKLEKGKPFEINGMSFTFLEASQYSGLQVSRDPGNSLIWVASALFLAGLVLVFYLPRRQIWLAVYTDLSGTSRLLVRLDSSKGIGAEGEFSKLISDIKARANFKEA